MSTETIQQKKKPKKTFDEIVEEIRNVLNKTKAVYIDMMAEALKYENPDWENSEIQEKIENTCNEFGWNHLTVYKYLPSWIHDQKKVQAQKASWERRHKSELEEAKKKISSIASDAIKEPTLSEADEEPDEYIGEPMLESYGDNLESALTLYGKINGPMNELFRALTKRQLPDSDGIDLILEYLKPSREFRKGIFYEIEGDMRIAMYNAMVYTRDALNDTLRILDDIHKKEGYLNE